MTIVRINRAEWSVPPYVPDDDNNLYVAETERLCCLGFMCEQVDGKTREEMAGEVMPSYIGLKDRVWHYRAAKINDDYKLTNEEREAALIKLYKGKIQFEFYGDYE